MKVKLFSLFHVADTLCVENEATRRSNLQPTTGFSQLMRTMARAFLREANALLGCMNSLSFFRFLVFVCQLNINIMNEKKSFFLAAADLAQSHPVQSNAFE